MDVTAPGCPEGAHRAAHPLPTDPGDVQHLRSRAGAPAPSRPTPTSTTIRAGDPNDRRMIRVIICWRCYCGEHDRCPLVGAYPDEPGIGADCSCARIRHPEQMVIGGLSSRLYDATGRPVDGP
jgi:hypothetical protein